MMVMESEKFQIEKSNLPYHKFTTTIHYTHCHNIWYNITQVKYFKPDNVRILSFSEIL